MTGAVFQYSVSYGIFSNQKDEIFNLVYFLFFSSILLTLAFRIVAKVFDWKFFGLLAFGNALISLIIGFILLGALNLPGTPKNMILVYGSLYLSISLFLASLLALKYRGVEKR